MYELSVQVSQDDRRLIALLESPVALVDAFGRILVRNAAFDRCCDNADRQNLQDFLSEQQRAEYAAYAEQITGFANLPEAQFEAEITLQDISYRMALSPLHPGTTRAVFLCQLLRVQPPADARLDYLMEHLDQGVWDYDVPTGVFSMSKVWRVMRGIVDDDDLVGFGDDWLDTVHPDDRAELSEVFEGQTRGLTEAISIEYRQKHVDGHWVWILCRAKIVERAADGTPLRIVGTDTDVTPLHRRDRDMHNLTNKFKMALEVSGIGIWEYDPGSDSVHWDDRLLEMYGRSGEANLRPGDSWETYLHPDDQAATTAAAEESLHTRSDFRGEFRILRPDGEVRHIRSLSRYITGPGRQDKLIGVNIDQTDEYLRRAALKQAQAKLEHDARHDALTGLANRRLLDERSTALFTNTAPTQRYAALHIDLDHFKQINDTLGHAAGDAVLVHVADQLGEIIAERGLTARSGGDEFVVLFENAPTDAELHNICNTIIRTFKAPFVYQGQDCAFGVSIGCAVGIGPPAQANELFIHADAALYTAKQVGRGCYRFYDAETSAVAKAGSDARQAIVDALSNREFLCYLQPQFAVDGVEIVGVEALVRWQCPHRGLLTPEAFMWQAVHADLTERIDAHVFAEVIAMQSRWFAEGLQYPPVSINISKARFHAEDMIDHVRSLLQPHHAITFELLETAFWDDLSKDQLARIAALRELGIGVDLDDFGSGHASVAAMQALRPDRIKFDHSLVAPVTFRAEQITTLKLLAKIARLEGVGIVVEGLDTAAHLDAITVLDCDVLQGYALQVPMPVPAFEKLLRA